MHRERPDHIERARDRRIGEAPHEPGDRSQDHRQDRCDERRHQPDQQRVAPAVEEPHGRVAAIGIGAEQELALPGRPDRHPVERDHVRLLAVDQDRFSQVVLVRVGAGRAVGPERSRKTHRDHDEKQHAERNCSLVALEPPQREPPWTDPVDVLAARLLRERRRVLERVIGSRLGGHGRCGLPGRAPIAPSRVPNSDLLSAEQQPVVLIHRMDTRATLGVHSLREERARLLVAVGGHMGLIVDHVLVERGPLVRHVLRRLGP